MAWVNAIIQGVLLGGLYALFAAGLSVMFGVMRFVNIAHGDFIITAAYFLAVLITGLAISPVLAALLVLRRDRGDRPCIGRARSPGAGDRLAGQQAGPFGVTLEPGHLMLSGSFTRPVWADKGDTLHADFGPLGAVAVRFA